MVVVERSCPFCQERVGDSLFQHIQSKHGDTVLRSAILRDKENGASDVEIGERYGISFGYLERLLTREYGVNAAIVSPRRKKITLWGPRKYELETTSVWSFKSRGNWATHDGRYRGNWSPYIPRNLILRYTKPGETVLDYFVGGGTTAVEAKLLGRQCIAMDINPAAVALTLQNLDFQIPGQNRGNTPVYQPKVLQGDARDLSFLDSESVDMICAHPPYAGIINYSGQAVEGDLSSLPVEDFIIEMRKVARESYRVLRPGRQCAILIGDARKAKYIIPIAFQTIRVFLEQGFLLRELVVKRQHNCKSTGFWYTNSIRYNFLLLAHEFLPVFEKPSENLSLSENHLLVWSRPSFWPDLPKERSNHQNHAQEQFETTTVWVFPAPLLDSETRRNLRKRFLIENGHMVECEWGCSSSLPSRLNASADLVYLRFPAQIAVSDYASHLDCLVAQVAQIEQKMGANGYCVIEAQDYRADGYIVPMGMLVYEALAHSSLRLREIIVLTTEEKTPFVAGDGELSIVHRYLLVYRAGKFPEASGR